MIAPAWSQDQPADDQSGQKLERVEITGSAIRSIDAETAVPVTVYKMDDLKAQGVTTVEQVLSTIAASQTNQGTSQAVGATTGGAVFADLRGLGQNKTLVLLDGRRLANNTVDGSAPDLNMIPFAALQRVEVLRDGASSLYGTDAVGGVINFITRKTYNGGSLTLGADMPRHPGGKSYDASATFGVGDLEAQRFNLLGVLDYQKQDRITAAQRDFGSTGFIPDRGLFRSSGNTFPANYHQGASPTANPAGPACDSNEFIFHQSGAGCRYDFSKWVDLVPNTQRTSGLLKGTLRVAPDNDLTVSYFKTRDQNDTLIAPVPYAGLALNAGTPFFPGNGITPAPTNFTIDPTAPISVSWRSVPGGGRHDQDVNTQQRFLVGLDGTLLGWDYKTAVFYNESKFVHNLIGGYTDDSIIVPGIQTGIINPFGAQTAAGAAAIANSIVTGEILNGKDRSTNWDGSASHELGDWFATGRPAAVAVGAEFRHETISFKANPDVAARVQTSTGIDPNTNDGGKRSIEAVYTELSVPVLKILDVTGSVRYDHYSDVGSTTNPKISFRLQPLDPVLIRGSASTGFRAPSLFEINNPTTFTNTANAWNDPLRCPNGTALPGFADSDVCNTQFLERNGGTKGLSPEKSKQWSLGVEFQPTKNLNMGVDFWWVRLKHSINQLTDTAIFSDTTLFAPLFHRAPDGHLSINGSECPGPNCGFIDDPFSNRGGVNTNGFDLSANYRFPTSTAGVFRLGFNGTYISKYEYQNDEGGVWFQNVGLYGSSPGITGGGPIFRLQFVFNVDWTYGEWGAGAVNHWKSGYYDQNDPNQVDPAFFDRVGDYSIWDLYGSWSPTKNFTFLAGLKNVFDTKPPFSNQGSTFQVGYDPRFTDSIGRTLYLRGTFSF